MRKKLFRFAVALLAFAAVSSARAKPALAAVDEWCPETALYQDYNVYYDCTLANDSQDCATCVYYCPGLIDQNGGYEQINMCVS